MSKKKVLLRGVFINRDTNGEGVLKVGTTLIRVSTVMGILYNGKKYKIKKKNDKYIITSRVRKEDFINYIDVLGNEHSELFMKIVNANEVDIIYNEDILIKYKDKYFHLFADKVSRNAVLADSYMIWTNSEQLAQEYIFEKKEQFVFIKYITRKEIGAVKIVKTPVLDFKDIEQSEEIIEGDALDSWLSELI